MGCGASAAPAKYQEADAQSHRGSVDPSAKKVFMMTPEEKEEYKKNPDLYRRGSVSEPILSKDAQDTMQHLQLQPYTSEPAIPSRSDRRRHSNLSDRSGRSTKSAIVKASIEGEAKDCKYHKKNCTDRDLKMASTILQAYPFDDSKRKNVHKIETSWSPDEASGKNDWGYVSVVKMGPKVVSCFKCGDHVVDRYEERPFFFCLRCRNAGKRFELCVDCYNSQALATGPRTQVEVNDSATSATTYSRASKAPRSGPKSAANKRASLASLETNIPARDRASSEHSSVGSGSVQPSAPPSAAAKPSKRQPHAEFPSGRWTGKLIEGASGRPIWRQLFFDQSGIIDGQGGEARGVKNCTIGGSVTDRAKVVWTEVHDWGELKVYCELGSGRQVSLTGKFTASDGGGGKIELTAS